MALGAVAAVTQSVRCVDAARELARLAARGEPGRARAVAAQLAPRGAQLALGRDGDTVSAEVTAPLLRPLPVTVGVRAVAAVEPGVTAEGAAADDTPGNVARTDGAPP